MISWLIVAAIACMPPLDRHYWQGEYCRLARSHRTALFCGGLGAGKSIAGADALCELLYGAVDPRTGARLVDPLRLPPQTLGELFPEVWIMSKSYTLADQAWGYFRWRVGTKRIYSPKECRKLGLERHDARTHWLKPSPRGDNRPICVRIRTAHDPEALRATHVLLAAWGDEIAHWPELAWLNLQGRGIVTPTRYLLTTTPKGRNWLYRDVYLAGTQGNDKSIGVVTCRSADNPWADKEYLRRLRAKFGPDYAAQELDALFVANVGYVYDFDRQVHMKELPSNEPDFYDERVIGVDPGYGDPYAACVWLRDHAGVWWMAAERYVAGKAIADDFVPWIREQCSRWGVRAVYVDKRRPSDVELLRRRGIRALPNLEVFGEDGRRTIMPMVRIVQRLFREGKIFIAPSCEWTAEEFENYAFPSREAKNAGENPVDYRNHLLDASRYAIASVEGLPQDRRPRYRQGADQVPRAKANPPKNGKYVIPSAKEYLAAQDRKFDLAAKGARRGRG